VDIGVVVKIGMEVVGGLGIFLLGMKHMSEGMQAVAGEGLRRMINAVTNNRIFACLMGTLVTCIVQSSSVTTVMVVGLVNGSFMTLTQAIGVIMGANIGTTITGWILVLKIGKYGLPMLGVAALFYLFSRKDKLRYFAMTIMGIGMVFFGLELMSSGFKPLQKMPEFVEWFHRFQPDSYFGVLKCALAGCLVTMIVQSSSATLGITIGLAEAGMIPYETAAALVLGENIGTTITALLASIGATTNARRAALSHTVFNITGVLWVTAIFGFYIGIVKMAMGGADFNLVQLVDGETAYPHMRAGIAATHTIFNVVNTLIFLPLLPLLARLVTWLLPEKAVKETPHLSYLNVRMLDSPAIGIQQSQDEIVRMGESVQKMMVWLRGALEGVENPGRDKELFQREEILDVVQKEVVEFLSHMVSGNVTQKLMVEARQHLRMADEYESVSDYAASILKLHLKLKEGGLAISVSGVDEILELHDRVSAFVAHVNETVRTSTGSDEVKQKELHTEGKEITRYVKELREKHLVRVQEGSVPPLKSLAYTDMLTAYRRIKDHGINIVEAIAG